MTGDETSTGMIGFLADRFELREVGVGNRITADILASTMYNLDNDPTFLNMVDINAAIQWDRFQAGTGGGTVTMFAQAFIIPEPGLLPMLALGLICGCVSRRRRI